MLVWSQQRPAHGRGVVDEAYKKTSGIGVAPNHAVTPTGRQAERRRRWMLQGALLSLPLAIVGGGMLGAWAGDVRIGLVIGAAFGFCGAIALLAAFAISAAARV